jgi:hypothetical protein
VDNLGGRESVKAVVDAIVYIVTALAVTLGFTGEEVDF